MFYILGSILLTLPLLFYKIKPYNFNFIKDILIIFQFNFNLMILLLLIFGSIVFFIYDVFIFKDKDQLKKNIIMFEEIIGGKRNVGLNLILSILSGYFEELLFKGYMYYVLINIIKITNIFNDIYLEVIIIIFVSIIFALFHIVQGKEVFIVSFLLSLLFFISIKLTDSIWYAISFHSIINFIELTFIIQYQKKSLK